jgi:hypothetical protein
LLRDDVKERIDFSTSIESLRSDARLKN